jgi:hypothetical protein
MQTPSQGTRVTSQEQVSNGTVTGSGSTGEARGKVHAGGGYRHGVGSRLCS